LTKPIIVFFKKYFHLPVQWLVWSIMPRLQILLHLEFTIHLVSRWLIVDDYITTNEGGSLYFMTMCVHSIFEDKRLELIAYTSFALLW